MRQVCLTLGSLGLGLARPQSPFFEFSSFSVPAASFNSDKFAPLVTRLPASPSLATIQDPDLFTIAGPPYPSQPTPPPYTSYPVTPAPVQPQFVYNQQSYVSTLAPVDIVTESPETAQKIADVMVTKMTPFVDLGLTESLEDGADEALKEVEAPVLTIEQETKEATDELPKSSGKGVVKVQLTENDIKDIMMAIKEETEEEEGHTLTKTDLVEMAVERLKEMEDKLGNDNGMCMSYSLNFILFQKLWR